MKIVIVGQGAIGLLWYSHLNDLYPRDEIHTENSLQQHSLTLRASNYKKNQATTASFQFTSMNGTTTDKILHYATDADIQAADVILLAVKSYQVKNALLQISSLLKSNAIIILCHNGMGTLEELSDDVLNSHTILMMLTTNGCLRKLSSNTYPQIHITHTGVGYTDIGLLHQPASTKLPVVFPEKTIKSLLFLLKQALPPLFYHKNIKHSQWTKLAINCVINPLTAIHNVQNGDILDRKFDTVISNILQEVLLVAYTQGVDLSLDALITTVKEVAKATQANSSSMRCDVNNQQKTEIDYINGYIHRLGLSENIATPENTKLWQHISQLN